MRLNVNLNLVDDVVLTRLAQLLDNEIVTHERVLHHFLPRMRLLALHMLAANMSEALLRVLVSLLNDRDRWQISLKQV